MNIIEHASIYRKNCPPPPEPKEIKPFSTRHPNLYNTIFFMIALLIIVGGAGLLTFGMYWVGSFMFHLFHISTNGEKVINIWSAGFLCSISLVVPVGLFLFVRWLGRHLEFKLSNSSEFFIKLWKSE